MIKTTEKLRVNKDNIGLPPKVVDVETMKFESTHDFYATLDRIVAAEKGGKKAVSHDCSGDDDHSAIGALRNQPGFCGCTKKEYFERRYKWAGGLEKIRRLSELDAMIHAAKIETRWSDYDGDNMDIERYNHEQPFLSRRVKVSGGNRRGQYRIMVNIGENCHVDADNMLWKAYAAARLCDEIESQGNRVEVMAVWPAMNMIRNSSAYTWTEITVKKAQDPVNLGLLCTSMSPWMLRYGGFAMAWHHYNCHNGLGRAMSARMFLDKDVDNTAILIDQGDCLTHERADQFIQTMDLGDMSEM